MPHVQDNMLNDPVYNAIAQQKQQQQMLEQMHQIQLQQLQMLQQQQHTAAQFTKSLQHPCSDHFSMCPNILKRANLIPMEDYNVV